MGFESVISFIAIKRSLSGKLACLMQQREEPVKRGFIKSTDHRPTDHRPTDHLPTDHRPTDHLPTDTPTQPTRFYFKDLINEEYSFNRRQTQLG